MRAIRVHEIGAPEVMRLDPCGPDRTVDETRLRLRHYIAHHERHGFSKWIVLSRSAKDHGLLVVGDHDAPAEDMPSSTSSSTSSSSSSEAGEYCRNRKARPSIATRAKRKAAR